MSTINTSVGSFTPAGVHCELVDFERLYESVSEKAILVNDFNIRDDKDKERLNNLLFTEYDGDTLDTKPTCDCGTLQGEYNKGATCRVCNTKVVPTTERPIESVLWVRVPDNVRAFMSPVVWTMLNSKTGFRYRGIELVRWLCDASYKPNKAIPENDPIFIALREMGWKRSLNHFIDNFDMIIDFLLNGPVRILTPSRKRIKLEQFIAENKHRFFTRFLPIPNRSLLITERTAFGTYVDEVMFSAIDAVRTITSLESSAMPTTQRVRENRASKVINQLAAYYAGYTKDNLSGKPGMFRRQVYGSRLDFSGRAVISSLSGPHKYYELHFPWGLTIVMLKTHITNKLLAMGYSAERAEAFITLSTLRYNELMDNIIEGLLEECPYPGFPVVFQRNPSLVRGSAQQLYITKVKKDPKINTISMSVLVLSAPNADFDGDEMNAELLIDKKEHDAFSRLAPEYGVLDTHRPFKISGNVKIPGPVLSTVSNWMHAIDD